MNEVLPGDNSNNLIACSCLSGDFYFNNFTENYIGMDNSFGEISIMQCKKCGIYWLRYYYVNEAFSGSGRWYNGIIEPNIVTSVTTDNSKAILENLKWYYAGGSYFDGKVTKKSGALNLFP